MPADEFATAEKLMWKFNGYARMFYHVPAYCSEKIKGLNIRPMGFMSTYISA